MSSESDLLSWLNSKANSSLKSISDAKSGREIAFCMVLLSKSSQFAKQVLPGNTAYERSTNFRLVKVMFGIAGIPYQFNASKLIEGDQTELTSLVGQIRTLDVERPNNGGQTENFSDFINNLEEDLTKKLDELNTFKESLDDVARERDFYMNKLLEIEKDADQFPKSDVETILHILSMQSTDFLPPE